MNDDDVDQLLSSRDPARALPPLSPLQLQQLTDQAMAHSATRRVGRRRSSRRLLLGTVSWVGGIAAVVAIAVPLALAPAASPGVDLALKGPPPGGPAAVCAPVSADTLRRSADTAFRGTVTATTATTATLHVDHRYNGDPGTTVSLPQGDGTVVDGSLPVFTRGEDYLIASASGTVLTCGSTGSDSRSLRAIYDRAFD